MISDLFQLIKMIFNSLAIITQNYVLELNVTKAYKLIIKNIYIFSFDRNGQNTLNLKACDKKTSKPPVSHTVLKINWACPIKFYK